MALGTGYDAATKPSVAPLTKPQRQRLEAFTFASRIVGGGPDYVYDWIKVAKYIETGEQ